ncbi:hypothetical protein [Nocardioides sp. WS12]|uniref:hypothetical protein n=1 Tax=Nocardioides sp. WS12 TaxID=2486272 RepID=UPI0015FA2F1E|nr:hypothetical protein [Nocardioides sp. WS12]
MNVQNPTPVAKAIDWWLGRVWPDLAIGLAFVAVHAVALRFDWLGNGPNDIQPDQRGFIYVALSTVTALAAGTNNTAVGSYVSSAGGVVDKVRRTHGRSIRISLRSIGTWLWVVAVVSLVCLAIDPQDPDRSSTTHGAAWVAEGLVVLAVVKFSRLTLIQDLMLAANDLSRVTEQKQEKRALRRRSSQPAPVQAGATDGSAGPSDEATTASRG